VKFDPSLPDDRVNVSDTHPLKEALTLVAGVMGVSFVLFFGAALAIDAIVPRIPPSFEARIFGGDWIDERFEVEGAEPDPRAAAVSALLERIAAHWAENPYVLRSRIWEEDSPNAFALPGGRVVLTTGLLDAVESENELAFVLGHELGHFRDRDHLRGIGRASVYALAVGALGIGGGDSAVQLAATAVEWTERGFGREQETAADRFGLGLVQAEYGHIGGSADFFEHLPDPDGEVAKELAHYLSTHPLSEERSQALEAFALERGWPLAGTSSPLGPSFEPAASSTESATSPTD
jgi:Zn-dependent protease with chaperone function